MAEIEEKKVEIPESTKWKSKAEEPDYVFRIFACGGKGGAYQSDLTSFFIAHKDQPYNFISMDAGSCMDCIRKAKENGVLRDYLLDNHKDGSPYTAWNADAKGKPFKPELSDIGYFKQNQLNGFLVTHAHIDHTAGLVVGSADDAYAAKKPVIAQTDVVTAVKGTFKQPLWPGMFDPLQFYVGKELNPGDGFKEMSALGSESERFKESPIHVKSFRLSHDSSLGDSWSTAFLICTEPKSIKSTCVLFFGDVGPDEWEQWSMKNSVIHEMADVTKNIKLPDWPFYRPGHALVKAKSTPKAMLAAFKAYDDKTGDELYAHFAKRFKEKTAVPPEKTIMDFHPLKDVWDAVIPLIDKGVLKTIFIETSYDNDRDNKLLFGHLTPKFLGEELAYIDRNMRIARKKSPITVFAMHIKPKFAGPGADLFDLETPHSKILAELDAVQKMFGKNKLSVKIEIPYQTDMMYVQSTGAEIVRHGEYLAAKADVQPMQLQPFRSESDDDDDDVYGERIFGGNHVYQERAYQKPYLRYGQGFGGYAPYQVMGYAPGNVVDAPPPSVVGSQSADLLPIFLALGTLICCVAVVFGMFVCGWVFHRVSRPRKVPRFARLSAQDQDDIEYGGNI
mmetsp:Transcript_16918/g.26294  ORF Transcript_16918/g.26294 Transcript_16918/m.26294 type:complete len:618 (+) Transcript_16918:94-1947(+)